MTTSEQTFNSAENLPLLKEGQSLINNNSLTSIISWGRHSVVPQTLPKQDTIAYTDMEQSLVASTVLDPETKVSNAALSSPNSEMENNRGKCSQIWKFMKKIYFKINPPGPTKLGTFQGVMVPCILSMFSVILFLRIGMMVGQSGFFVTIAMFILAYFVTILTVLSLSAISTNEVIRAGGAYYMISRALGPELGGAIGLLFYFANTFGCALYVVGLNEVLITNFGSGGTFDPYLNGHTLTTGYWWNYMYGTITLMFALIVCIVGAGMFAKTTLLIFVVVSAALFCVLVSFWRPPMSFNVNVTFFNSTVSPKTFQFIGFSNDALNQNLFPQFQLDFSTGNLQNFTTLFAILFNGCTGIMAGANMSGDLKKPGRSIPVGTIQAVAITFLIYIAMTFITAYTCSRPMLLFDYIYMVHISYFEPLVVAGVMVVTLSASLSNLIGASRVLQAVAKDEIFGIILWPFKFTTRGGNPLPAVFMSWFISQLVLFLGKVNVIAPFVAILFLLSYANVNLSCLALEWASAPNFRPTFTYFNWITALIGFLSCVTMMFVVNPPYAGAALVLYLILIVLIHYKKPPTSWGDITQALIFHQVRKYLLMLDIRKDHVKYWRPQILLMVSNPRACIPLIQFMNQMKKSGLYIIAHVQKGSMEDDFVLDNYNETYQAWLKIVDLAKVKAFVDVTISPSIVHAFNTLIQVAGLGGMRPNTIVLGFYDECEQIDAIATLISDEKLSRDRRLSFLMEQFPPLKRNHEEHNFGPEEYVQLINDALRLKKNVCVARHFGKMEFQSRRLFQSAFYIDIWLVDPENVDGDVTSKDSLDNTQLIMLQFACILKMVPRWKNANIRVYSYANTHEEGLFKLNALKTYIEELRIRARVEVVLPNNPLTETDLTIPEDETFVHCNRPPNIQTHPYQWLNRTIREKLFETKVVFCYLPKPPGHKDLYADYLSNLDSLTSDLPPCILIYGETEVHHITD